MGGPHTAESTANWFAARKTRATFLARLSDGKSDRTPTPQRRAELQGARRASQVSEVFLTHSGKLLL